MFMNVTLGRSVERSIGVGPGCELSSAGEQGEQGAGRHLRVPSPRKRMKRFIHLVSNIH